MAHSHQHSGSNQFDSEQFMLQCKRETNHTKLYQTALFWTAKLRRNMQPQPQPMLMVTRLLGLALVPMKCFTCSVLILNLINFIGTQLLGCFSLQAFIKQLQRTIQIISTQMLDKGPLAKTLRQLCANKPFTFNIKILCNIAWVLKWSCHPL